MSDYMPKSIKERFNWFTNLNTLINDVGTKLGFSAARIDSFQAAFKILAGKWDKAMADKVASQLSHEDFLAYEKGVIEIGRKLIKDMKNTDNWNDGYAKTLLVYTPPVVPDLEHAKPVPHLKIVTGQVLISYFKDGMDGVSIERKINNNGEFVFLDSSQNSPYIDNDPPLVAGGAQVNYYRLTYRKNDKEVGQVSDVVWIAYAG